MIEKCAIFMIGMHVSVVEDVVHCQLAELPLHLDGHFATVEKRRAVHLRRESLLLF